MIVYVTCTKVERQKYDVSPTYDIYFSISFNTAIFSVLITVNIDDSSQTKKASPFKKKKTSYDCCSAFFVVVNFARHRLFVYLMTPTVHFMLRKILSYIGPSSLPHKRHTTPSPVKLL